MNPVRIRIWPLALCLPLMAIAALGWVHPVQAGSLLGPADIAAPASLASIDATAILTPTADAFVSSASPDTNFGGDPVLSVSSVSDLAFIATHTFMQFDLSGLPSGSIINRAELRLFQTSASGEVGFGVNRVTGAWDANTITWNTRPGAITHYGGLTTTLDSDVTVIWDMTSLVQTWVYQPVATPNFGLHIFGPASPIHSRIFHSAQGTRPPRLIIDYTAPPDSIFIPRDTAAVTPDGQCSPADEYANAASYSFLDANNALSTVYLKHDDDNIYFCFVSLPGNFRGRFYGVYLDTANDKGKYAALGDFALRVAVADGNLTSFEGTGDSVNTYQPVDLSDDWTAVASFTGNAEGAEYRIARSLFKDGCASPFGLVLLHQDVNDNGDNYGLPPSLNTISPDFWLEATLEYPNCIRVCSETAVPCSAASEATVYNAESGAPFALDNDGYVIERPAIAEGDLLWATLPVSSTPRATLYHTSGLPQEVTPDAFRGPGSGIMTLVVSGQRPLLIQDLDVSAQWWVEGDPNRVAWLRNSIEAASKFLYDFTDGQFALGQVKVFQSYDGWLDSDLQLHVNNSFQPRAVIGGIVVTETADISPTVAISYTPGNVYMGSYWNRFGTPPGQPVTVDGVVVPTETLELDWALAFAHELSHYLLYLFDVYTDVDGNASDELAELCTGSAMGDVYTPSNQGFIFDVGHWDERCSETEAYTTLSGRTEWETIHLWHPWTITPTTFITGPVQPVGITQVSFVTPTVPPGAPATSQVFDLLYQDNETNSAEARVFILRNNRVYEQGKPAKGANQVELIDAQLEDRLCVYDINDNAEGSETPRHQFGCEIIQLNDATLQMTKNVTWAPEVALLQTGASQLSVVVTQVVTSPVGAPALPLVARLYPEHGEQVAQITLAGEDGHYAGVFNLTEPVPPVYLQLYVGENPPTPATRREVIADRGTGGSGAFGPARNYGKVPVVSSDGNASYESEEPFHLAEGESIAWQSMPGTPPLPSNRRILGQSYRLDAFPAGLVSDGAVTIQFESLSNLLQSASSSGEPADSVAIHFWDGAAWRELATTIITPINGADNVRLATAPSQGIGVYAVLIGGDASSQIFFPVVRR
jgi:hypothetical protein